MPVQIAYFFVPLSDPLGLPDGFTLAANKRESFDDYMKRVEGSNKEDSPAPEISLTASLKFWHASIPRPDMERVEQLFIIAQKALPGLPAPQAEALERPATPLTIVEMVVPLSASADDPVSTAFDEGLDVLRGFQRAYHVVRKRPLKLISRQRLPQFIPFGIRSVSENADEWPSGLSLMVLHWNVTSMVRDTELTATELEQLRLALHAQPGWRVFASYTDLLRDAMNSLHAEGDYRAAVLFFAAATEVFLDDLLAHMLWEDGVRPEDAAGLFEGGLQRRLRTSYHVRLGGSGWALNVPGALRDWNDDIATIRHRVIHAGYDPTSQQAMRAADARKSLEDFIEERLLTTKSLQKYPRTAMSLYGRPGLERRKKWNSRLQRMADDPSEVAWIPTFLRWKETMQRYRSERPPGWREPRTDEALVVGIAHPGPILVWVLHDRDAHMARRSAPPYVISAEQSAAVEEFIAERTTDAAPESFAMFGARAKPLSQFDWVPEYRLLPMTGVMVTGKDLDPPSNSDHVAWISQILDRTFNWLRLRIRRT